MTENKPMRVLDLFCCEGGAGMGYHQAGYDVVGIDIDNQRRYPFAFIQTDALAAMSALIDGQHIGTADGPRYRLEDFDLISASPPCQAYSITKHSHSKSHPELIEPTRQLLQMSCKPYIIENVVGAPLISPTLLCGTMFGLQATDTDGTPLALRRHRLFETNWLLTAPKDCYHDPNMQVGGVYGGGSSDRAWAKNVRRGGYTPAKEVRAQLIGADWMTLHGLAQSIPPAYTKWIGEEFAMWCDEELRDAV